MQDGFCVNDEGAIKHLEHWLNAQRMYSSCHLLMLTTAPYLGKRVRKVLESSVLNVQTSPQVGL